MSLPLNPFLEESFISLDVLTDDYVNTLKEHGKALTKEEFPMQ